MFRDLISDLKHDAGDAARLGGLAIAAGACLGIATLFLSAAAVVFVSQNHGAVWGCIAGAAIFLVAALAAIIVYYATKRAREHRLERVTKKAASSLLNDPATIAIALQVARVVGVKRLVPLIAIGGVIAGVLASRNSGESNDQDS